MHKRIVVVVSMVLFALLSIVAGIIIDMNDQFIPLELGVKYAVYLDFGASELLPEEAYQQLGMLSDQLGLGLIKVAPDLSVGRSGQVFVVLGSRDDFPEQIRRFGDQPYAQVKDRTALAHTYASGQYLVTGDTANLVVFKAWLTEHQIVGRWKENSFRNTLELLVRQSDFGLSLLAAAALMVSLVLYWLSVKARGRAQRVLAGVSTWRIQVQDLSSFLFGMSAAALCCSGLAAVYVGLAHGWVFVPSFVRALLTLEIFVILITTLGAVTLSAASWPSAAMLARREPAVKSLRWVSIIWQAGLFILVLSSVAPAFRAYTDARHAATEQAQWNLLGDQVVLSFPAWLGEPEIQIIMPDVGKIVQKMESHNAAALSYTWSEDHLKMNDFDLGPYDYLSLVNQQWFNLMGKAGPGSDQQGYLAASSLIPIPPDQVPVGVRQYLGDHMPLWTRQHLSASQGLSKIGFYRYEGPVNLPIMLLSGELVFSDSVIVGVVPGLYELFNDSFLVSVASSRNLVLTGLGPTLEQVEQHGLQQKIAVRYVAEEGILRAQFTAYFAQLRAGSLFAQIVALVVAGAVSAFITAVLNARRDFPLRLAGEPWAKILIGRVARDWAAGAILTLLIILAGGPAGSVLVVAVAAAAILTGTLAHQLAARWVFTNVSLRRL